MLIRMLDAWSAGMPRLARAHVSTEASIAAQETLLAVINGWPLEDRATLKTWIYRERRFTGSTWPNVTAATSILTSSA